MITRAHRFHGRAAMPMLYRRSNVLRGPSMNLRYVARRVDQPYRLAVVVSRKVHKSAVVRNRIRRRTYEIVRLWESQILGSYDMAITVYSDGLATLGHEELKRQLADIFVKAGILDKQEHAIVKATGK
jgi:ribonuclease P protein component